jgi:hypothetical protein
MKIATQFKKVRINTDTDVVGLVGDTLTVQFQGCQVSIVGSTPEDAAAAYKKLTDGLAPDMDNCQKVVMVSAKSLGFA